MWIAFFLVALILWFGGYWSTTGLIRKESSSVNPVKIISPPKWLYYLCGAPESTKFSVGTMTTVAFRSQIAGIILGICSCIILWKPSQNSLLFGLAISAALPYVITYLADKHDGTIK